MKTIKIYLTIFVIMMFGHQSAFAILNDDCSLATSLGTLPAPAACSGTSLMVGATVTLAGQTTFGSTPESPYPYLSHCPINTASPPSDVWYSFVASSYQAVVSVTGSTMTNPVITVWGGSCGLLTGMGCVTGSGGAATITIYQTVPGQTYYIQIAGSTSAQVGSFTLSVHNDHDCAQCLVASNLTASPAPVNGAYAPGTTVTFCLTVTNWNEIVQNWIHGIQPSFGSGWNLSTLTPGTPPTSKDGHGLWSYYAAGVTSSATGTAWPAGFYYYSNIPNGLTGGPGNTYGDNCQGACTWQFCFTITTNSVCSPGSDLGVTIRTSADGESGVWSSPGCAADPIATFAAIGACCPPLVSSSPDTCGNGLGKATASAIGSNGPWTYRWSAGTPAIQVVNGPSTVSGLTAGTVNVTVTDRFNCTSTASINIVQTSFAGPNQAASCVISLPGGSVMMGAISTGTWSTMAGNPGTATIANTTDPHTIISNFSAAGTYNFLFSRVGGCIDTAQVVVSAKPSAGGNRLVSCVQTFPGGAVAMGATAVTGASWVAMAGNPGTATIVTPSSPVSTIFNYSALGVYSFIWANPTGCQDTASVTVTSKPGAGSDQTQTCVTLPGAPTSITATSVTAGTWSGLASNPSVATISTPSSLTTNVSSFTAGGTYNFVWTASTGCKDTVGVIINPLPVAPPASASPITICNGSTTSLVATSAGNNILWYLTASGGAPLTTVASGASYSVSPASTTTYYAEAQSIGGTFTQTFSYTGAAQTWTVPSGATTATVYLWGGGGGGGGASGTKTNGGGGGGGAMVSTNLSGLTAGNNYTINIGAGGIAGTTTPSAGGVGGSTSFSGALGTWTVAGGAGGSASGSGTNNGGAGANSGTGSGLTILAGGTGGSGTDGSSSNPSGGGGGGAGSGGAGAAGSSSCGAAAAGGSGTYTGGTGGVNPSCGINNSNAAGGTGTAPGGGGSGGHEISTGNGGSPRAGGAGAPGQVVIVYTIATCTSPSRTSVTVNVVTPPAAVTVSGGGSSCNNATLTATGGAGGTIYWQNTTSGGVSLATPSSSQTVSASGTYYFNSYNGVCFGPDGSATVTIIAGPTAPTASATPATICNGSSSSLSATSAGNTIKWYTASIGGSLLSTTASGGTYSVSPSATTSYYAEAQAASIPVVTTINSNGTWTVPSGVTSATVYIWGAGGGGGAARSNNNVSGGGGGGGALGYTTISGLTAGNVYNITIGTGGAAGTGNSGATAGSGSATSFSGALGTWTANGGTGGTDNNGNTSGTGGAGGSTGSGTGMAFITGGNGSAGVTAGNITGEGGGGGGSTGAGANGATTCTGVAAAGGSGTYPGGNGGYNANCGTNNSLIGANGAAAGGGASGAHRGNSSSQNGGVGGAGQVVIVYTVTTCPSTRTAVTVTVNDIPTAVTVSGGGASCSNATLTASGGTNGTIYWENTSSNATSTATPSTSQSVSSAGTYYFRANNTCGWSTQGSAVVTINSKPNAGADKSTCQSGGSVTMGATAVAGGVWSSMAGNPGTATISTPSNALTTISTFSTSGTYNFIWTAGTGCTDTASVVVNAKPNAGIDQSVSCPWSTATMVGSGTGTWTAMAGNPGTATITTSTSPTSTITNFSVAGTYNFIWTNATGCTDTAAIVVGAKPNAGPDKSQSCVALPGGAVDMAGVGTGTWTAMAGNPGTATISTPSSPTTAIINFSVGGTYNFIWTSASGCTDTAAVVVVSGCTVTVSGSIFDDANGNGVINGTDVATSLGQTLYAIVASNTNIVLGTSSIAAGGTFTVTNIPAFTNGMKFTVSTTNYTVGSTSGGPLWPSRWVGTLGQYGTSNAAGSGLYAVANQLIPINTTNSNITGVQLGFDRLPTSSSQSFSIGYPTHNAVKQLVPASGLGVLSGSDPEDGAIGVGQTFTITGLVGLNGNSLYYDLNGNGVADPGEQIVGYTTINNFIASRLLMKFTGSGSVSASFQYGSTDAAAQTDPTPATYLINWVGALPVKMISFAAEKKDENKSMLTWATATEIDNDHFEIERSADAQNWEKIGETAGKGNTTVRSDYSFTDHNTLSGINYYRLKQVDADSKFEYSSIELVEFENSNTSSASLTIYPNPLNTNSILNLGLSNSDANIGSVSITNAMGQIVYINEMSQMSHYALSDLHLTEGIYFLSIHISDNSKLTTRLVIQ